MCAHVSSVIQVLLMHFGSSVTEPKVAFEIVVPRRVTSMDRHLGHHTDCVVLSAANRAAFQGYVHELLSAGHHAEAEAAWDSVFEVVHRPWAGPVVELPPLRPMRIVVCTKTDCIRCREGRSGFVFPFLGPWSRRRVIVAHGLDPATAWEAYNHNEATMDRILIAMYSSGWQVPDFCPPIWDSTMARASTQLGGAATDEMLTAWRTWQFGEPRWISPVASPVPSRQEGRTNARHRAQRAMVAWLSTSSDGSQQRLPGDCIACVGPASHYCQGCGRGLCRECEGDTPTPCCMHPLYGRPTRVVFPCRSMEELRTAADGDVWNVG